MHDLGWKVDGSGHPRVTVDAQTPREETPGVGVVRVAGGTGWTEKKGEAIPGGEFCAQRHRGRTENTVSGEQQIKPIWLELPVGLEAR